MTKNWRKKTNNEKSQKYTEAVEKPWSQSWKWSQSHNQLFIFCHNDAVTGVMLWFEMLQRFLSFKELWPPKAPRPKRHTNNHRRLPDLKSPIRLLLSCRHCIIFSFPSLKKEKEEVAKLRHGMTISTHATYVHTSVNPMGQETSKCPPP